MTGSSGWLRRAGRLDGGGGETILWSVAEGRRGRRWRSIRRGPGGPSGERRLISDLLVEVDPDGRWTRLELATERGILTLHPQPGGAAAHGNVVSTDGVAPLVFAWSGHHRLVVVDEPVAAAALGVAEAEATPGPGLVVGPDLRVSAGEGIEPLVAPPGGLPGPSWPLEE